MTEKTTRNIVTGRELLSYVRNIFFCMHHEIKSDVRLKVYENNCDSKIIKSFFFLRNKCKIRLLI